MPGIYKNQQGEIVTMTYYVHQVPGRLRVRIPEIRNNSYKAAEIETLLNLYGVETVEINHLTGSVVVAYNPQLLDSTELLHILREKGYYDSSRAITCDEHIQRATSAVADKAGRYFFGWAVGKALESSGFSLLAAFI
jgi:hypothetical protein